MAVTEITNHVAIALSRLLSQYAGQPNISGLIAAIVTPIQDLENGINELETLITLATATGVQLDGIGSIVGQDRNGLDDTTYRLFIYGKIGENVSNTTIAAVSQIYAILASVPSVREFELYPASVALAAATTLDGIDPSLYTVIANMVSMALGAGISLGNLQIYDPTNPFECDSGNGFGSDLPGQTGGGIFGMDIYNDSSA